MSEKSEPTPVKNFVAIIGNDPLLLEEVVKELEQRHGRIDIQSEQFPFSHTDYYQTEMGENLFRQFVAFEGLISPEYIPDLKTSCAHIEHKFSFLGNRRVNLDPGYMDFTKVVLASYKVGGQKIYLRDGVYADIVLLYAKGHFESFVWTFPDFSTGTYSDFLLKLRRHYKLQYRESTSAK